MALLLACTWNQALLATVIDEARAVADDKDSYVGRTALQKIMYFLKVSGVPMDYRFEIHNFGPFCDEILNDTDVLIADEVVEDRSTNQKKYSNYAPASSAPELIGLHSQEIEKHRGHIQSLVKQLVPLKPDHLELLATLDFAYRWVRASGGNGPWKDRSVVRFIEIKKEKFAKSLVEKTYDDLVVAGLFEH